ncbi:Co-chaperone Hsc20, partial [Daedalea quercina L-15889]
MFRRALTAALPRSSFAASRLALPPARHVLPVTSRVTQPSLGHRRLATTSTPRSCPQCSARLTTPLPVCTKCYWISSIPSEMTYHEMLGIPYEPNPFVVDTAAIKRNLRQLQTVVHPDRWVGKEQEKQDAAAAMSSRVNEALHRLSSPLRRVEYILQREGYPIGESENLDDREVLRETMDMREAIEEARNQEQAEEIRAINAERLEETMDEITNLIGQKNWRAAKAAAIELKYWQGVEDAAEAWPHTLGSDH